MNQKWISRADYDMINEWKQRCQFSQWWPSGQAVWPPFFSFSFLNQISNLNRSIRFLVSSDSHPAPAPPPEIKFCLKLPWWFDDLMIWWFDDLMIWWFDYSQRCDWCNTRVTFVCLDGDWHGDVLSMFD